MEPWVPGLDNLPWGWSSSGFCGCYVTWLCTILTVNGNWGLVMKNSVTIHFPFFLYWKKTWTLNPHPSLLWWHKPNTVGLVSRGRNITVLMPALVMWWVSRKKENKRKPQSFQNFQGRAFCLFVCFFFYFNHYYLMPPSYFPFPCPPAHSRPRSHSLSLTIAFTHTYKMNILLNTTCWVCSVSPSCICA